MNVLLVIDMQKSVFTTARLGKETVINNINRLAQVVRANGGLVIFIQHNGTDEEGLREGTDGWAIINELNVFATDLKITKTACDAFYRTDLEAILKSNQADNVIITGAVTEFCVDTTLRSCLSKDLNVTLIADAHTTGDRAHISADLIVTHHNWVWKNLILPGVKLAVINTDAMMSGL